ncbi:MAG: methyltransferase domain-containing protein [bacterium]
MIINTNTNHFMNPDLILKDVGVEEGMRVADLGCGSGYFSISAAKIVGEKGKVFSVDCMESALDALRSKASVDNVEEILSLARGNLEVENGSGIASDSIDFAILKNVLSQSESPEKIINEASRVLKKGGKLLLVEWTQSKMPIGPDAVKKLSEEEISKFSSDAGLVKTQRFEADKYHYGVVFVK